MDPRLFWPPLQIKESLRVHGEPGEDLLRRCHFFNTFFFQNIKQTPTMGKTAEEKAKAAHDKVKRWTKR